MFLNFFCRGSLKIAEADVAAAKKRKFTEKLNIHIILDYQMLESLSGCIVAVTNAKSYILHFGDMLYTKPRVSKNAVIWVYGR